MKGIPDLLTTLGNCRGSGHPLYPSISISSIITGPTSLSMPVSNLSANVKVPYKIPRLSVPASILITVSFRILSELLSQLPSTTLTAPFFPARKSEPLPAVFRPRIE